MCVRGLTVGLQNGTVVRCGVEVLRVDDHLSSPGVSFATPAAEREVDVPQHRGLCGQDMEVGVMRGSDRQKRGDCGFLWRFASQPDSRHPFFFPHVDDV